MSTILQVSNLFLDLKLEGTTVPILRDLSFHIPQGSTVAIVGETGCGKSMTAAAIMQLLPKPQTFPLRGKILFEGRDLLKASESEMRRIRGKEISMIFQDPRSALNPIYTIGDQMKELCDYKLGLSEEESLLKIYEALQEVQLQDVKRLVTLYPHQLSGGMLQRVLIAMALLCKPKLLIADEPTTALDVTIQAQILELLQGLQKKHGMSILLITHDMGVVSHIADSVVVMYAGQRIESATTHDLFKYNMHPYTQALLEAVPSPLLPRGTLPVLRGGVPDLRQLPRGCTFHPRCPQALPICQQGKVPYFHRDQSDQEVKCWLYDQDLQWKIDEETFAESEKP